MVGWHAATMSLQAAAAELGQKLRRAMAKVNNQKKNLRYLISCSADVRAALSRVTEI
jgi:hypothetical protein